MDSSISVQVANNEAISNLRSSPASQALVSVVLLSYNRPALLEQALSSVLQQSFGHLEITVVDNLSPASSEVERVVGKHPQVKLLRTTVNLGYTGGMNRGLDQASGAYVLLTQDDIVLGHDCIQRLIEFSDENPAANLIAPIIYDKNAKTIRCAGGKVTLGRIYRKEVYGAGERDTGQFPKPFEVNYIDGAAMFASRDFWRHFKGFREEYFMYVDAVELCARVSRAGRRMTVVPKAKVYHFEPSEGPTPSELDFHKLKNFFSLYLLHAPLRVLPEFVCRYAFINGLRSLFSSNGNRPRVFFKALLWVVARTPSLLHERYLQRNA